jgi:hypothetical protein
MIALVIAFCCGAAAVVLWRLSVSRRPAPSVAPPCTPPCTWGREYDIPTYLRRRNAKP